MTKRNEDMIKVVRAMRKQKIPYRQIAKTLNKDLKQVWRWAHYK